MVRDDEVGRQPLAHRGGVRLHPGVELGARQSCTRLHRVAVVLVDHEHRQQPADVGADGRGAAEVVPLGVRLLREDRDVVAGAPPLPRELAREDVRARAGEQVAVPDEDPHHGTRKPVRSIISGIVTNS